MFCSLLCCRRARGISGTRSGTIEGRGGLSTSPLTLQPFPGGTRSGVTGGVCWAVMWFHAPQYTLRNTLRTGPEHRSWRPMRSKPRRRSQPPGPWRSSWAAAMSWPRCVSLFQGGSTGGMARHNWAATPMKQPKNRVPTRRVPPRAPRPLGKKSGLRRTTPGQTRGPLPVSTQTLTGAVSRIKCGTNYGTQQKTRPL